MPPRSSGYLTAHFAAALLLAGSASAFDCAVETKCPEMSSCAEARYKFQVCGHSKRDADGDGIPCENICGDNAEIYAKRSLLDWPSGVPAPQQLLPSQDSGEDAPLAPDRIVEDADFTCGSKRTCREMISCEEARFYLTQCNLRRLDGDGDGTPCNALCR